MFQLRRARSPADCEEANRQGCELRRVAALVAGPENHTAIYDCTVIRGSGLVPHLGVGWVARVAVAAWHTIRYDFVRV